MGSMIAVIFDLLVCIGIPLGVLGYLLVKKRRYLISFLLGAATFVISQLLVRIPLQSLVQTQGWYVTFAVAAPMLAMLLRCFTAGLFEESGRWLMMRFVMKRHRSWNDGVAFGLGHGGIEAMTLVAPSLVWTLVNQWALLSLIPAGDLLASGVERLLTLVVHVGLSLVVMTAVNTKRTWLWPVAILLHTWVNFATLLTLGLTGSTWSSEAMLAVCALGFGAYIVLSRKTWRQPPAIPAAGNTLTALTAEEGPRAVKAEEAPTDEKPTPAEKPRGDDTDNTQTGSAQ